ncbi:defective in Cullin neddylation protein 1 [Athelia psychrophila]|uniref:Defective in cullin neddylation protein n=1 Tax=Athelia psychrophila TaxID=1759441 RepID=A0A166VZ23_9AGAM|nr:defective in Cullin neddylation protein 1 [Fibularhizoctonia sp. CBS 109695]
MEDNIAQFCGVTGASVKDAKKYLEKFKRVDIAIDSFYNDPGMFSNTATPTAATSRRPEAPSTSKLNTLFDKYKASDGDDIMMDGTMELCEDLDLSPDEDCVLYALAYELKSPRMGEWNRKGWVEGWKSAGSDNITAMKAAIARMRTKLASDPVYFQKVYVHTFDFARAAGQRSLPIESAQAFWSTLIPHALKGGALSHISSAEGGDIDMDGGWTDKYTQWWFDFLAEKGGKGVSKDTWVMFTEFVRTIDSKFENYDAEAAWPSQIDDFVEYAKARVNSG